MVSIPTPVAHPTKWHPPELQDGAMIYEANPNQNGDGNLGGEFYSTTLFGSIRVDQSGHLIIILPTTDPGVLGALWNSAGTPTISSGPPPPG
jgi:hypothetical protein